MKALASNIAGICLAFALLSSSIAISAEELFVNILVTTGAQRAIITQAAEQFEKQNPNIKVNVIAKGDRDYKESLPKWLDEGKGGDVILWHGGERLFQYVRKDRILDISDFWQTHQLHKTFNKNVIDNVSLNKRQYGLPVSYYHWGFFYRRSLFAELNLSPPKDWQEFLTICEQLKNEGITPITIGTSGFWSSAIWFDYFNLRINGLEYHRRLLTGQIPFTDDGVYTVFKYWKELIDKKYFLENPQTRDLMQAIPYLYRNKAGMALLGNFFTAQLPDNIREDMGFFRFPIIHKDMPIYEEAPIDLFMIPSRSKQKKLAKKFLLTLAKANFQQQYNSAQQMIAPNVYAKASTDPLIMAGNKALKQAAGLSQYFDRDTNNEMAEASNRIFTDFIDNPNIAATIKKLEAARNKLFNQARSN